MRVFIKITSLLFFMIISNGYELYDHTPKLPIKNISDIHHINNLTKIKPSENHRCVVIYTNQSCKPCHKLALRLKGKFINDTLISKSIIYFNSNVMDLESLSEYIIEKKEYQSPYYYSLYPNNLNHLNSYPYITFHNPKGEIMDSIIGYNNSTFRKIKNFLK
mgnify:CR=1 FL=1